MSLNAFKNINMDLNNLVKNVKSLNEYSMISRDMLKARKTSKIPLNMSTILCLKTLKGFEVEYFFKYCEPGAALIILEKLLLLSPTKVWEVLGKEIVSILKYWLQEVIKKIMVHHDIWWFFIDKLLLIIRELTNKDSSMPEKLVEGLGNELLLIVTNDLVNYDQKIETITHFNMCTNDCTKAVRKRLRLNFEEYFVKLAQITANCGDICTQYNLLETLLRWLVPRDDIEMRRSAARKWFPPDLFPNEAKEVFYSRTWTKFHKDGRDFLQALNSANNLVVSIYAKKLSAGNIEIISRFDSKYYLDLNISSKSITLFLDQKLLGLLNVIGNPHRDVLKWTESNTVNVKLVRDSMFIQINITVKNPSLVFDAADLKDKKNYIIFIKPQDRFAVNNALEKIFGAKYKIFFDIEQSDFLPSEKTKDGSQIENTADYSLFSNPREVKKNTSCGEAIIHTRNGCSTPSSTASLPFLRNKLSALPALPPHFFNKVTDRISKRPQLSNLTEVSETDDDRRAFPSDQVIPSQYTDKNISSLASDVLEAVGSVNDNILGNLDEKKKEPGRKNKIKYTQLRENKTLEEIELIPDLPVKVIENKAINENITRPRNLSPFDVIENTPDKNTYDNILHNKKIRKQKINENYNEQEVEELFSYKRDNTVLVLSPTIARKVNETSSESEVSDNENEKVLVQFNQSEVDKSLQELVNKVCEIQKNVTNYKNTDICIENIAENLLFEASHHSHLENMNDAKNIKTNSPDKTRNKPIKLDKIEETVTKKQKLQRKVSKKSKAQTMKKVSTNDDNDSEIKQQDQENKEEMSVEKKSTESLTDIPLIRRRRKLYSPKSEFNDTNKDKKLEGDHELNTENVSKLISEIQNIEPRKNTKNITRTTRILRTRKYTVESLSPRSKKLNETFDKVLKSENNNVCIKTNNPKLAMYNYQSEDDSDFKTSPIKSIKKSNFVKRNTRRKSGVNKAQRKPTKGKNEKVCKTISTRIDISKDLNDEKMRAAQDVLENSFIARHEEDLTDIVQPIPSVTPKIDSDFDLDKTKEITKKAPPKRTLKTKKKLPDQKVDEILKDDQVKDDNIDTFGLEVEVLRKEKSSDDSLKGFTLPINSNFELKSMNDTHNLIDELEYSPNPMDGPKTSDIIENKIKFSPETTRINKRRRQNSSSSESNCDHKTMDVKATIEYNRKAISPKNIKLNTPTASFQDKTVELRSNTERKDVFKSKIPIKKRKEIQQPEVHKNIEKSNTVSEKSEKSIRSPSVGSYMNPVVVLNRSSPQDLRKSVSPSSASIEIQSDSIKADKEQIRSSIPKLDFDNFSPKPKQGVNFRKRKNSGSSTSVKRDSKYSKTRKLQSPGSQSKLSGKGETPKETSKIPFRSTGTKLKTLRSPIKTIEILNKVTSSSKVSTKKVFSPTKKVESLIKPRTSISKANNNKSIELSTSEKLKKPSIKSTPKYSEAPKSPNTESESDDTEIKTSVKSWLRHSRTVMEEKATISQTDDFKDLVSTIKETMEVTLAGIHQASFSQMRRLQKESQEKLNDARRQRFELFKETIENTMKRFSELINAQFTEMENRFAQIEEEVMQTFCTEDIVENIFQNDKKRVNDFIVTLERDFARIINKASNT